MSETLESTFASVTRPSVSGCDGITTWIKKALMPKKQFNVGGPSLKSPAGKAGAGADKGLHIGRATDHELTR